MIRRYTPMTRSGLDQDTAPPRSARWLNAIFFGRVAYGIQEAAQAYFGKNIQDVSPVGW